MVGTPYAFFQGELMPLAEAKIGLMTHAFNYGTAVFEGIRANWNAEQETLYLFRTREHYERLRQSAHVLMMELLYSDDDLVRITQELVTKSGFREDLYIRPMVYKAEEVLGVRLHDVADDFPDVLRAVRRLPGPGRGNSLRHVVVAANGRYLDPGAGEGERGLHQLGAGEDGGALPRL